MAASAAYTVTSTPVLIASAPNTPSTGPTGWFYLANGAAIIYLGGPSVSATNGVPVTATTGTFNGYLFAGDSVYAVCATTSNVTVFQTGL
jgi:hypothetical protein